MKKLLLTLVLVVCCVSQSMAQRFPVTVVPQVNPPAPVNFYNYADASTINSPLQVQLLLSDISVSNLQVRLKVSFEGNGIRFESRDLVIGANPLFIDGGTPLMLRNAELAPYFEFQNLQGINANVYGQTIPEGSYQFCYEVFEFVTGNRLSSKTCATTYIFKNEPPILNLPLDGTNMEPQPVDNIVFQWTPRHINVSNVEYELSLVEIWDDGVDPQTAFLSSPPVFQTTTRANTFVYGPAQPQLLNDKRYAWQVRAKALQGAEEIGLFKNEGKSEIFWFSKVEPCAAPLNVYAEPKGMSKMNVFWDEDPATYSEYTIAYREADKERARWFTMRTNSGWATVWDLKPGTTYEYKVKAKCKYQYSEYTQPQQITTESAQDETANYNCGIVPDEIAISNREPHPNIMVGDRITAGDFVITITDIESESNGRITGVGYVRVPYFELARFAVTFNGILINTDNQLAEGEIVTLYDPTFGENYSMTVDLNVTEWFNSIGGLINDLKDKVKDLLGRGEITEEEANQIQGQLTEQEDALDQIEKDEERIEELEKEEGKEDEVKDLKDKVEKDKAKLDEGTKAVANHLSNIESQNQVSSDGGVQSGDYFDGIIPFSTPDKSIVQLHNEREVLFTSLDEEPDEKNPDGTFFISETSSPEPGKTYIVSRSNFGESIEDNEDYKKIKEQMSKVGSNEYLLWIHYDFKNNEVKYKVAFGSGYYANQIAQNELVQLYNDLLNFDFRGAIGSNIVRVSNYFDGLLVEFKDYAPFMNEELLQGYKTYELLQMVLAFVKSCGEGYTNQDGGLIPRCLWDHNINPAMAYYAGFIDGAFEIGELGWDAVKFFKAWNPGDPYFFDPNAFEIRQQTIDLVLMVQKLDRDEMFLSTAGSEVTKSFDNYLEETVALTPQARYNQGKLVFEVASFFFGVGEAKAFLTTGKITSKTLQTIQKLPKSFASLIKGLKGTAIYSIKRIDDITSKIIINGQEIARMTKEKLIILGEAFLKSVDDNLQPVGQLITPEGMIVRMDDGTDPGSRIFNIIKDTKGNYKAAVGKLDDVVDDLVSSFKSSLKNRIANESNMTLHYVDNELKVIIDNGKKLDLPEKEIEDIIFNGCRNSKKFTKDELISQTNFWKKVKDRGYPNLFEGLREYEKFGNALKNLTKRWNLPSNSIFVQGSALRVSDISKIGDLDVAIKVDKNTFNNLVDRFKSASTNPRIQNRIGKNGKIGGGDMFGSNSKAFGVEAYDEIENVFKQNFTAKFGVEKLQISIIQEGGKLDIMPLLPMK